MKSVPSFVAVLALTLVATSCKQSESASPSAGSSAQAPPNSSAPRGESKTIAKLGIKIDVPAGASLLNESEHGVDINFDDVGVQIMTVEGTTEADALTFADAIAKVEAGDPCPFGAWIKKDRTATGWHLQWTCKAAPTASKTFTNVDVRTIIDGKHLSCGNQVSKPDELASVAAACASVTKL